jgi:hypothetical protein
MMGTILFLNLECLPSPHHRFMRRMVKSLERRKENLIILPNHPLIHSLLKHLTFFSVDIVEERKI